MTVTVIDPNPSPKVLKECLCYHCGVKLQYTPNDVKESVHYDYGGGSDTVSYIKCANCQHTIYVR